MSRIAVYPYLIGKSVSDSLDAFYPDRYTNLETAITLPSKSNTITVSEWLKEYSAIFQKDAQQFEKRVEEAVERFLDIIRDLEFPFAVDVEIPVVITLPSPEITWVRAKVTDLGPAPFRPVVDDDMLLADETGAVWKPACEKWLSKARALRHPRLFITTKLEQSIKLNPLSLLAPCAKN